MLNDYSRLSGAMLERMETSVAEKAPHLLPVVQLVRDCGVGFLVIPQRATGLDRGIDILARPFVVLVGDDRRFPNEAMTPNRSMPRSPLTRPAPMRWA